MSVRKHSIVTGRQEEQQEEEEGNIWTTFENKKEAIIPYPREFRLNFYKKIRKNIFDLLGQNI